MSILSHTHTACKCFCLERGQNGVCGYALEVGGRGRALISQQKWGNLLLLQGMQLQETHQKLNVRHTLRNQGIYLSTSTCTGKNVGQKWTKEQNRNFRKCVRSAGYGWQNVKGQISLIKHSLRNCGLQRRVKPESGSGSLSLFIWPVCLTYPLGQASVTLRVSWG